VRVATYRRISTDEEMQPHSLDAQEQRLDAYVQSQEGWRIVRRFEDRASGATLERPGLQRAIQEAEAGRFDLLLVYRVDRLARSVRGLAQLLEQLDQAGVAFRSASEPFDTTSSAGRMMVQMLGVFAEFERATIVDRVIAGMERKASRGEWTGGARPFGYRPDAQRRHLEPDPAEAPVVREVFERYAKRLEGTATLAAWLTERGYRTKHGKPFNAKAVLTVLRNRAYLGEVYYRGQHYPAPHQPLVDAALFERAQNILEARSGDYSLRRSNQSDYLLTGLVTCAYCGKRYVGAAANSKAGRYRYYVCFTRQRYGSKHCPGDRLRADHLEDAIIAQLHKLLRDEPLLETAIRNAHAELETAKPKRVAEAAQVAAEITKTQAALSRYFDAFEQGTLNAAGCAQRTSELTTRLRGLEDRQAELTANEASPGPQPLTSDDVAALAAQVGDAFATGSSHHKKALLQALISQIRVEGKARVQPFFNIPAVRPPAGSVPPTGFEPVRRP
jgi:site-specific DNA recombinase